MLVGRFSHCEHKWIILSRAEVVNRAGATIGEYYCLQCQKCGDLKNKDFV